MPALRILWFPSCHNSRSSSGNTNHHHSNITEEDDNDKNRPCCTRRTTKLSWWIADDDLRGIAKYSIIMKCIQFAILVPTFILLLLYYLTIKYDRQDPTKEYTINNNHNYSEYNTKCDDIIDQQRIDDSYSYIIIVWFFCFFSFVTILCSFIIEIFIFRISSRGSPTQNDSVRSSLTWLTTIKLVPLSLLRIITVVLAMYTLTIIKELCSIIACKYNYYDMEMETSVVPCPIYLTTMVSILAYVHIVELSIIAIILLLLIHGNIEQHRRRLLNQLRTRRRKNMHHSPQWMLYNRRLRRKSDDNHPKDHVDPSRGVHDATVSSTTSSSSTTLMASPSCWHVICRCCCICTSCCTCCLFGGTEAFFSTSTRKINNGSSSLSDISTLLASLFDTSEHAEFDITPSDLVAGFTALRYEQQQRKIDLMNEILRPGASSSYSSEMLNENDDTRNISDEIDCEQGRMSQLPRQQQRAIVYLHPLASGSYNDSAIEQDDDIEIGSSRSGSSSNVNDDIECELCQEQQHESELSHSAVENVVQNLQLCRTDTNIVYKVMTRKRLNFKRNINDRRIIQDGVHYIKYAVAIYGHLMFLAQHPCSAPCSLLRGCITCRTSLGRDNASCCNTSRNDDDIGMINIDHNSQIIHGDNLCRCNELGFLLQCGLYHSDIVYASFKQGIKSCPYLIAADHEKKSIVIAIKGTFSLESLVTDLSIRPELVSRYSDICDVFGEPSMENEYCHSGMLHCVLNLYTEINSSNVLDHLLLGDSAKLPHYSLILTGHSLGAGCAAILAIMLRKKFPNLKCYCFAPPGCVVSHGVAHHDANNNNVISYVLDCDIVPRLSVHSVVGLRNDVLEMVARIKVPKHELFAHNTNHDIHHIAHKRECIPFSTYYGQVLEFKEYQDKLKAECNIPDIPLYPPGRIVHLIGRNDVVPTTITKLTASNLWRTATAANASSPYIPIWGARSDLAEIQLTAAFLTDHDPERYMYQLEKIERTFQ